jgi:hypothetical protein
VPGGRFWSSRRPPHEAVTGRLLPPPPCGISTALFADSGGPGGGWGMLIAAGSVSLITGRDSSVATFCPKDVFVFKQQRSEVLVQVVRKRLVWRDGTRNMLNDAQQASDLDAFCILVMESKLLLALSFLLYKQLRWFGAGFL